jgi:hypothetical protein
MRDPCITTDLKYDLREAVQPIEGVLEGRLQERFYRFENLKPGESLNIFVQMKSNTTASVSMLMLYEIRTDQYTQLASRQVIISESEPLSEEEGQVCVDACKPRRQQAHQNMLQGRAFLRS